MVSDPTSKNLDEELMLVDELVCLDDEEENDLEDKDFQPVAEEGSKEVVHADVKPNEEKLAVESVDGAAEPDNLDYYTISPTNHRFDMILSMSHFSPNYNAFLPRKIVRELPQNVKVPVVLKSYGKIWTMLYNGHYKGKRFDSCSWKKFLEDNELKIGDACFFELLENSPKKIVFKVVIMRTDCVEEDGTSAEKPIVLD